MAISFQPREVNFRAVRDMGLAAWWGSSLMNLAGLVPASRSLDDPGERFRVLDAGMKASTTLQIGAIGSYILGTELVRFGFQQFGPRGLPRWATEGVESKLRVGVMVTALGAAVGAKTLRRKAVKLYDEQRQQGRSGQLDQAESLRKRGDLLNLVVPAATGWLLYSHLKQDMLQTGPVRSRLFGRW